ncbi:MAG: AMP-binding protein [Acidobacteria bacterium]|nr:AMP-binding protein [Acidobacteriota bacterium]
MRSVAFLYLPEGCWGELCLGGIGLAWGYWNHPEIDSERFDFHPRFGRIYRTGYIVHREPDGIYCNTRLQSFCKLEERALFCRIWKTQRYSSCL